MPEICAGSPAMSSLIGARIPRLEDGPLLIGKGRFIDDIALPGLKFGSGVKR